MEGAQDNYIETNFKLQSGSTKYDEKYMKNINKKTTGGQE